jgi:outer membrane protein OmpA-like peptidoglycan-associated protein
MSRSPIARVLRIWPLASAALLTAASAGAQAGPVDEAAADAAARAALPTAEIRTIMSEVRSIQGLSNGLAGPARSLSGNVVSIATVQRTLERKGLTTRMVNGSLEVSLPGDVLFDFDKATIRPNAVATLEKVKEAAQTTGARPIIVEGHTDAVGTPAHNQPLSEARATAVASWLASAGVERARLQSRGYGATRPIAPNQSPSGGDDPAGRQRNRRVTVTL